MTLTKLSQKLGYEGQIIRVFETTMSDGRIFEKAVRSPGTRIIIYDLPKDLILLSKEYREEMKVYDFRLPGGKVRDKIAEWDKIKESPDLINIISEASKKEAREEAGINVKNINLFSISTSGGPTIEWTLYYFVTNDFSILNQQELEAGEEITTEWVNSKMAIDICLSGKMKEGRSSAILLQYFHSIGKI